MCVLEQPSTIQLDDSAGRPSVSSLESQRYHQIRPATSSSGLIQQGAILLGLVVLGLVVVLLQLAEKKEKDMGQGERSKSFGWPFSSLN